MTMTLASILALPFLGEGNFRRVYRDGPLVYKVETVDGKEFDSNRNEVDNYLRLIVSGSGLPANVRLPATALVMCEGEPVVQMEYIEGTLMGDCTCLVGLEACRDDCLPIELAEELTMLGIDCAYGNVIESGGTYYLVDLDADLR